MNRRRFLASLAGAALGSAWGPKGALAQAGSGVSTVPQGNAGGAGKALDRHRFGMNVTRLDPAIGADVEIALDITLK